LSVHLRRGMEAVNLMQTRRQGCPLPGGDQPYLPRYDPRYNTAAGLYDALCGSEALVVSHHPGYPPGSWCSSTDFGSVETDVEKFVALWSMHGSAEGYGLADRPYARLDPDSLLCDSPDRVGWFCPLRGSV
jgi:hypothetical protein